MSHLRTWMPARLAQGAALSLLLGSAAGCGSLGADDGLAAAQVRFVDVSPGSPEMDFYVNGTGAAYGIGYANFTSYLAVLPGTAVVSARRTGSTVAVASGEMTLSSGRQYTAIISHGLGNLQEHIYADQSAPAPAGRVALRILNEVLGTGPLNFYVSSGIAGQPPAATASLPSGAASAYLDLPASATYTVSLALPGGALAVPLSSGAIKGASGAVRTVVFAGTIGTASHSIVNFVLDDAEAP